MPWYYANTGQQVGPVTDADFERLAREGVIQSTTLVWREGMQQWVAYATIAPPPSPVLEPSSASSPPLAQVTCLECGKAVPAEETVQFGNAVVCSACKAGYIQKMREGALPPMAEGPRYGGFWIRVLAKIIDSLIVGVPIGIAAVALIFGLGYQNLLFGSAQDIQGMIASLAIQLGAQALIMVVNGFYTVWFVHKYSATPGKMICGLRVVNADGSKLSFGRNVGRYAAEIISGMACDLGYLVAAFDNQKRTLHDFICNTRVVYKR